MRRFAFYWAQSRSFSVRFSLHASEQKQSPRTDRAALRFTLSKWPYKDHETEPKMQKRTIRAQLKYRGTVRKRLCPHLLFLLLFQPLLLQFRVDPAVHKDDLNGRRRRYEELPPVPHPAHSARDGHAATRPEARPAELVEINLRDL